MKKIIPIITLFILLLPFKIYAYTTSASSSILMDMDTNIIIYSKNIHERRKIASITKIMTAIIAIENIDVNKKIVVSDNVLKSYGSGIYIKPGEELTIMDLLYGLMLRSGNDAAIEIAYQVSGGKDEFVSLMNKKATEIGMKNTTFINPHGLDEDTSNYSTAYDMAVLTSYAMKNEIYRKIVGTKKYTLKTNMNYYSWTNKNKLLFMNKYVTGGKTGYTVLAKRTLVSTASRDGINLVCVTLNDGNDFNDHNNLFNEAFNEYISYEILSKGNIEVIGDTFYQEYNLYIKNDFRYLLNKNDNNQVILKFNLEKKEAIDDEEVGNIEVYLGDTLIHTEKIYVSMKNQVKTSFWKKINRGKND